MLAVAVTVLVLGACDSDDSDGDGGPAADQLSTEPPADDPSAPTAAARATADELLDAPDGTTDCGVHAADSGWPTTFAPSPSDSACLVAALDAHERAVMTFTGRTGDGGALVTTYVLGEDGTLTVTRHTITKAGEVSTTAATCQPPTGEWLLGIEGGVVVLGATAAGC